MEFIYYISAAVAVAATFMAITRLNVVHALLYFIVSLLAAAVIFFILGAPFVAALVVIINAGAIIVLFVFVIMMLNQGHNAIEQERQLLSRGIWIGPTILTVILLCELIYSVSFHGIALSGPNIVSPRQVGIALFGPYIIGVELASMLLLAGLIGAYHLGRSDGASKGEK